MEIRQAQAMTVTVTRTFATQSYDGYIYKEGATWAAVHDAFMGTAAFDTGDCYVGWYIGEYVAMMRGFVFFDTSIIPDDAQITNATLGFYTDSDYITINITIQQGMNSVPQTPLKPKDYYYLYYSGNGGSLNVSTEYNPGTFCNITLNNEGKSWINKTGTTKFCLRGDYDILNVTAPNTMYISIRTAEFGEAYSPKLYVTYECEGCRYILHGPYYENGNVANQVVTAALEVENEGVYTYTFNGTDSAADDYTLDFGQRALSLSWNCSSTYLNTTRIIHLRHDLSFEELWLYVPNPMEEAAQYYTFGIADLVGISWGYLEITQSVQGQTRIIERRDVLQTYEMNFYLIFGRTYTMRLITNLGTHVYGSFTAGATTQTNLFISPGMFPSEFTGWNVTVQASRPNSTWINATYTDGQTQTLWVQWTVKHRSGISWITDDQINNTGNSQTFNWYDALEKHDYVLEVYAMREKPYTWTFSLGKPAVTTNPWDGLDTVLGDWGPIKGRDAIGIFLTLLVLGVFSYANIALGLVASWIMAAVQTAIGFLTIPPSLLGVSFFIVLLVAVAEAKKREREI